MTDFIALSWLRTDASGAATARALEQSIQLSGRSWQRGFAADGLIVLCSKRALVSDDVHVLSDSSGVILGTLFPRLHPGNAACVASGDLRLSALNAEALRQSLGRTLIESYWGRYVAFIYDRASGAHGVLRDPTGAIPCYCTTYDRVTLIFSSVASCLQLPQLRFSIDWDQIALAAAIGDACADMSALSEVWTVNGGEYLKLPAHRHRRETLVHWDPAQIAQDDPIDQLHQAVRVARATIRDAIHTWAARYRHVLVQLSGGLDSSIVAAVVARAPSTPRVTCLNLRTRDPESDERAYARLVAQRAQVSLIERTRDPHVDVRQILQFAPSVAPQNLVMQALEVHPVMRSVAAECGADVLFSGEGGDSLFYRSDAELAFADHVANEGFWRAARSGLIGTAMLSRLSVWQVLGKSLRASVQPGPDYLIGQSLLNRSLLQPDVRQTVERLVPRLWRWGETLKHVPPGKARHIMLCTWPFHFRNPLPSEDDPDSVDPLISQPIIEACLRIPTYTHLIGGRERAVERAAFEHDIPPEIANRFWKGGVERHWRDMLMHNFGTVSELLMDGELTKRGILDPAKLQRIFGRDPEKAGCTSELFEYACMEGWIQQWQAVQRQSAAA